MSFELAIDRNGSKAEQYASLAQQAAAIMADETDRIANAANFAALIFHALPDINWAGFYFYRQGQLVVGPFQGLPACVRIPLGRGVCGQAAQSRETQVVADVNAFPDHIVCDLASRSELVVPVVFEHELIGVFDLDSPSPGRFDDQDRRGVESLIAVFVATLNQS